MTNGENSGLIAENRPVSPLNGQPVPMGRQKGVPNKATGRAREAIAMFVEGNADRLTSWLDAIAEKDPDAAFKAFMSVVEYHIPKLNRMEQQMLDRDGKPADNKLVIEFINAPPEIKESNPVIDIEVTDTQRVQ